jgi:hypothetical protein
VFKNAIIVVMSLSALSAHAAEVPINGTVQSRCVITTDTAGVYGNPNAIHVDD